MWAIHVPRRPVQLRPATTSRTRSGQEGHDPASATSGATVSSSTRSPSASPATLRSSSCTRVKRDRVRDCTEPRPPGAPSPSATECPTCGLPIGVLLMTRARVLIPDAVRGSELHDAPRHDGRRTSILAERSRYLVDSMNGRRVPIMRRYVNRLKAVPGSPDLVGPPITGMIAALEQEIPLGTATGRPVLDGEALHAGQHPRQRPLDDQSAFDQVDVAVRQPSDVAAEPGPDRRCLHDHGPEDQSRALDGFVDAGSRKRARDFGRGATLGTGRACGHGGPGSWPGRAPGSRRSVAAPGRPRRTGRRSTPRASCRLPPRSSYRACSRAPGRRHV